MKAMLFALALLMVGCEESSTPSDPVDTPKAIDLDDNETRNKIIADSPTVTDASDSSNAIDLDDKETRDKIIAEAIDSEKLEFRFARSEELAYASNEQTPYTGWVKSMYDNGQIEFLVQLKDGNKLMTAVVWKPNGEKCPVTNVKKGNGIVVSYKRDGTELFRQTYKDGKEVKD